MKLKLPVPSRRRATLHDGVFHGAGTLAEGIANKRGGRVPR